MNIIKNSDAIGGRSEVLLAAASPHLYRINAFRISGLPIDATTRDISKQVEKLEMARKYGGKVLNPGGPLPLHPPPDEDAVREAMQRLRDPERRIVDELFWFWPQQLGESKNDEALRVLADNNIKKANEIWVQQERKSSEANISMHNLAVLAHISVLDLEYNAKSLKLSEKNVENRDRFWRLTFKRWKILLDHEGFWSRLTARIRQLEDPRLTAGTARRIRESLPLAILFINAELAVKAASSKNIIDADRHLKIINESGFDEEHIKEALRRAIEPIRKRIKTLCQSGDDGSKEPEKEYKKATQLINQTEPLLFTLDAMLPLSHPAREGAHDEVALGALSSSIAYANETEKWQQTGKLLQQVMDIAISESARERIQRNIDIFKGNVEYDLQYKTCFYCKKNPCVGNASVEVEMYGEVDHEYSRITWRHLPVQVPRCETCKKVHESRHDFFVGGGVSGLIIGILIFLERGGHEDQIFPLIFGSILIFSVLGAFIDSLKKPDGIKPMSNYKNFFQIKDLLESGWKYGDKPPEANQ